MGDFMTADFQFLSSARMGKLSPWGFLPIDGRLVGVMYFSSGSVPQYGIDYILINQEY